MKRLLGLALLALLLPSWGCAGYHRGYEPSYSPGCYSCSSTREHDGDRHRHHDHDRGGGHHRHHDDDHDGHHRRH